MSTRRLAAHGVAAPRIAVSSGDLDRLDADGARAWARTIERLGFTMLWLPEVRGREAFVQAQAVLQSTTTLVVGSGVARALERQPKAARAAAAALAQRFPGRYVLGLGVSGASRQLGVAPVDYMRQFLDDMDAQELEPAAGPDEVPVVIGAYSPALIRLAGDRTDGLLTMLTTAEHTSWARGILGEEPFLGVNQWVLPGADAEGARMFAREALAYYLTLPHQQGKFRRLGFDERDITPPGSDRLVDALVAWGDPSVVEARIAAHLAAGADQVALSVPGPADAEKLDRLATLAGRAGLAPTPSSRPPRLRKRLPEELNREQAVIYERITTGPRAQGRQTFQLVDHVGGLEGPFNAWLLSPGLGAAFERFGDAVRFACTVPSRWREIAILVVGSHWQSPYEQYAHRRLAASVGLSEREIEALEQGRDEHVFADPVEQAVVRLARRLVEDWGALPDAAYDDAKGALGEVGLFEISLLVGYYSLLALQLALFGVGVPPLAEAE